MCYGLILTQGVTPAFKDAASVLVDGTPTIGQALIYRTCTWPSVAPSRVGERLRSLRDRSGSIKAYLRLDKGLRLDGKVQVSPWIDIRNLDTFSPHMHTT